MGAVREVVPLSMHWPTVDPFLFCAHHNDDYPPGDGAYGVGESLDGRDIGQDFSNRDGWSMYHGHPVPGFPQHPHRGFETVTFARRGLIDHSDSLGARARFGRGDVQWLTAGSGIVHSEMFPLVNRDERNPTELFQIWLNLPASDKLVEPYFTMLWGDDLPRVVATDTDGRATTITLIAGSLAEATPPTPPPNSWAARAEADVAIWHIVLEPNARWTLPAARGGETTVRTLYCFEGNGLIVDGMAIEANTGVLLDATSDVPLIGGADGGECLLLQGRPIGEPVARYGPFVMNTRAEIQQAFEDYQRTQFGGWPWPVDGPVHDDRDRFADHPA